MNHSPGDLAGGAFNDDRLGVYFFRYILGGAANASPEHVIILEPVGFYIIVKRGKFAVVFSLGADRVKRANAFERIFTRGGFSRQHNSAGAVVNRVCNVADFGTRRARRGSHAFKHLCGCYYIFALCHTLADEFFLNFGQLNKRDFNAHVAARDHDTVGVVHDQIHVVNAALALDLCDNFNVLVADTVNEVAERAHILVISYK